MLKRFLIAACLLTTPRLATAGCCELRRVDANPATAAVRVCDSAEGSDCAAPLFEGAVTYGTPQPICSSADTVSYRELDAVTGSYGPPIVARCDAATNVEL
jgi:hypothetical protein